MTVVVKDQFKDVLDSVYDGQKVEERIGTGPWIHTEEISGGSYPDPVGPYLVRGQTDPEVLPPREEYIVDNRTEEGQALIAEWRAATPGRIPERSPTQDIDVRIAGHDGFKIIRKLISTRDGDQDFLRIEWPPQ